jgi:integral membrane protein
LHALRRPAILAPVQRPIERLRRIAWLEGISFLVLLGIAMPLKYWGGMPAAVLVVGWVHGVLFVLFCWALLRAMQAADWPLRRGALVFVAALVPFGPFVIDGRLRQWGLQEPRADVC